MAESQSISSLEKMIMERSGLSKGERALIEWEHLSVDVDIRSTRLAIFKNDSSKCSRERAAPKLT